VSCRDARCYPPFIAKIVPRMFRIMAFDPR